tara:strand:+ start:299 stop:532 length:234 start_codon:yes stop_codon:yes gene_type:complete
MFRLIVVYEISFIVFWNILYHSSSGVENWFQEKFVTAIYTVLSTMVLGFTILYIIYITLKISGISDKLKKLKDPRKS